MTIRRVFTAPHKGRLYVVEPVRFHPSLPEPKVRTQAEMDAYRWNGGVYVRVACIGSAR